MSSDPRAHSDSVAGLPDLAFDLVTILQNKLQAISALEKYKVDARAADHHYALKIFDEMQQADIGFVHRLRAMVAHEIVVGLENQHGFEGGEDRLGVR